MFIYAYCSEEILFTMVVLYICYAFLCNVLDCIVLYYSIVRHASCCFAVLKRCQKLRHFPQKSEKFSSSFLPYQSSSLVVVL